MKPVGKPDAGNRHVRFDERGWETGRRSASVPAPNLDSTIVLAYSFLTRGVYGGIVPPWTLESYQRLFDPLYLAILWRSFAMALAATALCLLLAFPAALFIARAARDQHRTEDKWQFVILLQEEDDAVLELNARGLMRFELVQLGDGNLLPGLALLGDRRRRKRESRE